MSNVMQGGITFVKYLSLEGRRGYTEQRKGSKTKEKERGSSGQRNILY